MNSLLKYLSLFTICLTVWLNFTPIAYAETPEWVCPLRAEPPPDFSHFFQIYIEPMQIQIAALPDSDPRKKTLQQRLNQMIRTLAKLKDPYQKFVGRVNATPIEGTRAEVQKLASEISALTIELLAPLILTIQEGELVGSKNAGAKLDAIAVQMVRSVLAADQRMREAIGITQDLFSVYDNTKAWVKHLGETVKAEQEVRSERFRERACQFIEREHRRRCEGSKRNGVAWEKLSLPDEKETLLQEQVMSSLNRRMRAAFEEMSETNIETESGKKHSLFSYFHRAGANKEELPAQNAREHFYRTYSPLLKMCGVYFGMQRYLTPPPSQVGKGKIAHAVVKKIAPKLVAPDYASVCERFLCDNTGTNPELALFSPPPAGSTPPHQFDDEAFCRYANDYTELERQYVSGYYRTLVAGREQQPFCPEASPLKPAGNNSGELRRLPPVNPAPKPEKPGHGVNRYQRQPAVLPDSIRPVGP